MDGTEIPMLEFRPTARRQSVWSPEMPSIIYVQNGQPIVSDVPSRHLKGTDISTGWPIISPGDVYRQPQPFPFSRRRSPLKQEHEYSYCYCCVGKNGEIGDGMTQAQQKQSKVGGVPAQEEQQ